MTKRAPKKLGKMEETGRRLKEQSQEITKSGCRCLTLWNFVQEHLPHAGVPLLNTEEWYSAKMSASSRKRSISCVDTSEPSPKKLKTERGSIRSLEERAASETPQNIYPRPPWHTHIIPPKIEQKPTFIAWDSRMFETDGEVPSFKKTNILPDKPPKPRQRYIQRGTLNSTEKNDRRRAQNREAAQRSRQKKLWQDKCLASVRSFLDGQIALLEKVIKQWVKEGKSWVTSDTLVMPSLDLNKLSALNTSNAASALATLTAESAKKKAQRKKKMKSKDRVHTTRPPDDAKFGESMKIPPMPNFMIPQRPGLDSDSDDCRYPRKKKNGRKRKRDKFSAFQSAMPSPPPNMLNGQPRMPLPPQFDIPSEPSLAPFGLPPPPLPPPNMRFNSQVSDTSPNGLLSFGTSAVDVKPEVPSDISTESEDEPEDKMEEDVFSDPGSDSKFEMAAAPVPNEFSFQHPMLSPPLQPDFQITTPEMPPGQPSMNAAQQMAANLINFQYGMSMGANAVMNLFRLQAQAQAQAQLQTMGHLSQAPTLPPGLLEGNYGVDVGAEVDEVVSDNTNSPPIVKLEDQAILDDSAALLGNDFSSLGYNQNSFGTGTEDYTSNYIPDFDLDQIGTMPDLDMNLYNADPVQPVSMSPEINSAQRHFQFGSGVEDYDMMNSSCFGDDVRETSGSLDLSVPPNVTDSERAAAEALSALMDSNPDGASPSLECQQPEDKFDLGPDVLDRQLSMGSSVSASDCGLTPSWGLHESDFGNGFIDNSFFGQDYGMLGQSTSPLTIDAFGSENMETGHTGLTSLEVMNGLSDLNSFSSEWPGFM